MVLYIFGVLYNDADADIVNVHSPPEMKKLFLVQELVSDQEKMYLCPVGTFSPKKLFVDPWSNVLTHNYFFTQEDFS